MLELTHPTFEILAKIAYRAPHSEPAGMAGPYIGLDPDRQARRRQDKANRGALAHPQRFIYRRKHARTDTSTKKKSKKFKSGPKNENFQKLVFWSETCRIPLFAKSFPTPEGPLAKSSETLTLLRRPNTSSCSNRGRCVLIRLAPTGPGKHAAEAQTSG